jgi:hypothetical protein
MTQFMRKGGDMKKSRMQFRQGDVLLVQVTAIPRTATQRRGKGRIVLAYGEVTGHAHAIADVEHVTAYEVNKAIAYLDVQMEAHLRHEEHAEIALPPGKYEVRRQREYTPEAIRNVAD